MNYKKDKFCIRKREMLNSNLFNVIYKMKSEIPAKVETSEAEQKNDPEWQKKLKIKENILSLHFKERLKAYKPKILI
jgi:hypothetical protein